MAQRFSIPVSSPSIGTFNAMRNLFIRRSSWKVICDVVPGGTWLTFCIWTIKIICRYSVWAFSTAWHGTIAKFIVITGLTCTVSNIFETIFAFQWYPGFTTFWIWEGRKRTLIAYLALARKRIDAFTGWTENTFGFFHRAWWPDLAFSRTWFAWWRAGWRCKMYRARETHSPNLNTFQRVECTRWTSTTFCGVWYVWICTCPTFETSLFIGRNSRSTRTRDLPVCWWGKKDEKKK